MGVERVDYLSDADYHQALHYEERGYWQEVLAEEEERAYGDHLESMIEEERRRERESEAPDA